MENLKNIGQCYGMALAIVQCREWGRDIIAVYSRTKVYRSYDAPPLDAIVVEYFSGKNNCENQKKLSAW